MGVVVISVFLVIVLTLPGAPPRERHRIAVADVQECVRRGQNMAEKSINELKPGVVVSIACEFSRT